MFPGLSPMEWVSVASFSLSLGALLARSLTKSANASTRAHLLAAVVLLAVTSGAVGTANSLRRVARVEALADRIYVAIGNQEKTTDQLLIELGALEEKSFSAAMGLLEARNRIDSRVEEVPFHRGRPLFVRLWRGIPE